MNVKGHIPRMRLGGLARARVDARRTVVDPGRVGGRPWEHRAGSGVVCGSAHRGQR
ncbi:MAG: hypothetical protein ACRD0K_16185 [Egibacteraceae bacterium]